MARRWSSRTTTDGAYPAGRWVRKSPEEQPAMPQSGERHSASEQPHDLTFFTEVLRAHCNDDTLIKGWEADRRICNGRQRAALRAAAKDVRQKSFKIGHNSSGGAPAHRALTQVERTYVAAVQQLHEELAKAQESDFDYMLKDGLEWLEERLGLRSEPPKRVKEAVYEQHGAKLLQKLERQRASGHRGKAIDRDLRRATQLHALVSDAYDKMDDSEDSQYAYLNVVDQFVDELAKAGEPDFDGKLRQAINFLQNGGKRLCF